MVTLYYPTTKSGGVCGLQKNKDRKDFEGGEGTGGDGEVFKIHYYSKVNWMFNLISWALIFYLLINGILSINIVGYFLNCVPYLTLMYFTVTALQYEGRKQGFDELMRGWGLEGLKNIEMWTEAAVQVIFTTGIGVGVHIGLASFNKFERNYLIDVVIAITMNIAISICAVMIVFCSIAEYIRDNNVQEDFRKFINSRSTTSSIEFGHIAFSIVLYLVRKNSMSTFLFFLMIGSFSSGTVLRLVQQTLDSAMSIFKQLKGHRILALLGVCIVGFAALFPMNQAGGVFIFFEYEYYTLHFIAPLAILIQAVCVAWIYEGGRIMDNAEQMGVASSKYLQKFFKFALNIAVPIIIITVLLYNTYKCVNNKIRFNKPITFYEHLFGIVFVVSPLILIILNMIEKCVNVKIKNFKKLFLPLRHTAKRNTMPHIFLKYDAEFRELLKAYIKETKFYRPATDLFPTPSTMKLETSEDESIEVVAEVKESALKKKMKKVSHKIHKFWNKFLNHMDKWPGRFDEELDHLVHEEYSGSESDEGRSLAEERGETTEEK